MTSKQDKVPVPLARKIRNLSIFFFALIGALAVGVYIFICPYFHQDFYDLFVLHPFKFPHWFPLSDTMDGIKAQAVSIPVEQSGKKLSLSGALYKHKHTRGLIIFCHGNTGPIDWRFGDERVKAMLQQNMDVLLFDYQGYGRSPGKHSLQHMVADSVAAYDYAIAHGYKPEQIVAYGESLGGGVACQLAGQKQVKGLVLECTFISTARVAKDLLPAAMIYLDFAFPTPRFDNLEYLKGKHPPCLILSGGRDATINPQHSQTLKEAGGASTELVLLPNSGHCLLGAEDKALYYESYKEFLNSLAL